LPVVPHSRRSIRIDASSLTPHRAHDPDQYSPHAVQSGSSPGDGAVPQFNCDWWRHRSLPGKIEVNVGRGWFCHFRSGPASRLRRRDGPAAPGCGQHCSGVDRPEL